MSNRVYLIDNDDSVLSLRLTETLLCAGHYVVLTQASLAARDWQTRFSGHYFNFEFAEMQPDIFDMLLTHVVGYTGQLDGLICLREATNASAFEHLSAEALQHLMSKNFFDVAQLVRAVLPVLRQQGSGRILNLSSTASLLAPAYGSGNVASKFALRGLLESVAREVDSFDIKISNVAIEGHKPNSISQHRLPVNLRADYSETVNQKETQLFGEDKRKEPDYQRIVTDLQTLLACDNPPMQVLFGEDAYYLLESNVTNMLYNIEYHQTLSASA